MPPSDADAPRGASSGSASSSAAATAARPREHDGLRVRLRATSIATRLVTLTLVLVGGTTLTVGMLSYRRARAELTAATDARLRLLARDVAQSLHRELRAQVVDITAWARLETMIALTFGDVDKELAELLRQTIRTRGDYVALLALDRDGTPVAMAGDGTATAPAWKPGEATRVTVQSGAAGGALLELAVRVDNPRRAGEAIGTLVAEIDPHALLHRVAADRIAGTGVSVTLDAAGRPLATIGDGDPSIDTAALEMRSRVAETPTLRGLSLAVTARQPLADALASIFELRATLLRIGITVVLLSGLAGALVAWRLSRPIRTLTASVEAISAQGSPVPIGTPPLGGGEVGVLARAFDTMLRRLSAAQGELVAQSRLALLGEVAAAIAHDVRTPLSVLKTSAQLLAAPQIDPEERRDLAGMVAMEVDRLNRVVTDLVDVTRAQSGTRTRHALGELADRAFVVLRPWAHTRGVTLEAHGDAEAAVVVDADQMQRVLLNLLHNATQASPAGARVSLAWRADEAWVTSEVSDEGPGFTEDALQHAFASFWTTRAHGTGLGLAIARRILEAHGGEIGARNGDGGGACVWFRLPRA